MSIVNETIRRHVESMVWERWSRACLQLDFPWTEEQMEIMDSGRKAIVCDLLCKISTTEETYKVDGLIVITEPEDAIQNLVARQWNDKTWPALSLLPWLERIDAAMVVSIAPEGQRCMPFHVVTNTAVVRSRLIKTGDVMQIADDDNPHGAMDWMQLSNLTKRNRPEHEVKTQELLNAAMAWEIHSITKKNLQ